MDGGEQVDAQSFYGEYHGHPLDALETVHNFLRAQGKRIVYLVGDSSLDNKHWLFAQRLSKKTSDPAFGPALNGFEHVLHPPVAVEDVCYFVNKELSEQGLGQYACINAAVEESTVSDREQGLLPHDEVRRAEGLGCAFLLTLRMCPQFVRDHLQPDDIVIVSMGGNDIALRPTTATMLAIGALNFLTPKAMVLGGWGPGFGHLKGIFCDQVEAYLKRLYEKHVPKLTVPCTIYYPAVSGESWANPLLDRLGYTAKRLRVFCVIVSASNPSPCSPEKLQALIDSCFTHMTSKISVEGGAVAPLALSTVLDCNDQHDYDNRVEPSIQGGQKMGAAFVRIIKEKQ